MMDLPFLVPLNPEGSKETLCQGMTCIPNSGAETMVGSFPFWGVRSEVWESQGNLYFPSLPGSQGPPAGELNWDKPASSPVELWSVCWRCQPDTHSERSRSSRRPGREGWLLKNFWRPGDEERNLLMYTIKNPFLGQKQSLSLFEACSNSRQLPFFHSTLTKWVPGVFFHREEKKR